VSAQRDLLAGWRAWRHGDGAQAAATEAPAPADATEALARELLHLAVAGAEALAADDPDLNAERSLLAAHYAAEPSDRPYVPGDPDPLRDGLLRSALMRPPSWEGSAPPPGAFCSCCSRHKPQAGGRWWRPRQPRMDGLAAGPGWRCAACHPPPPGCDVEERRT
jgi:hypothetical protein